MANSKLRLTHIAFLATSVLASSCKKETPPPAPVAVKAPPSPEAELNAALEKLPKSIDRDMYKGLFKTAARCDIDVRSSSVMCKNDDYFDNIVKICERGLMPRQAVLAAVSYVFAHGDDKQWTAGAELLSRVYSSTRNRGTAPNKKLIQTLIAQLDGLPEAQAVDAAPAVADIAGEALLEQELYPVLDRAGRERVAAAGYRRVMMGARMRVFEKLWDLVKSKNLDVAVAAVEAPKAMGGRTLEENAQVCDWMLTLTNDTRPVIQTRASAFLAGCGKKYLDKVLATDESRVSGGKPLSAGLDSYVNVCDREIKNPYGDATKAQCGRLKKIATKVLNDSNSGENDRVRALELLADQFPGKDTLALATRFADDGGTASTLSRKAQDTVRELASADTQKKATQKN